MAARNERKVSSAKNKENNQLAWHLPQYQTAKLKMAQRLMAGIGGIRRRRRLISRRREELG